MKVKLCSVCNIILDSRSWVLQKVAFSVFVLVVFSIMFIHEYKRGHQNTQPHDWSTLTRNVSFFVPVVYTVVTKNPIMLCSYSILSLSATVATETLKFFFPEERPDQTDRHSFPSGHSVIVFFVAHFMFLWSNKALGIAMYAVAFYTGYLRILYHHHWAHDVMFGAMMAILIASYGQRLGVRVLNIFYKRVCRP